ncbi:hypothetical protein D3C78_548350 [compost metagenome]
MSEIDRIQAVEIPPSIDPNSGPNVKDDAEAKNETGTKDAMDGERLSGLKNTRKLRKIFAHKAYKVAKYGLYWWATVLLLSAVGKAVGKEIFSDQVLIAVTTASTLNLFAAFLGVIRGLFPSGKDSND